MGALTIKTALEIEKEDFQNGRAIAEGRAGAEARHAVKPGPAAADPHRIDAVPEPAMAVEVDIGGGVAQPAAAFLAMDHLAPHEPGAAEHAGGRRDLPLRERPADPAGRDRPLLANACTLHIDLPA